MRMRELGFSIVVLALAAGCAPGGSPEDAAKLSAFVVGGVPEEARSANFDFGGKVQIVGTSVSPSGTAAPGSQVTLTLYWKRTGSLEPGWGLFTHIENDEGRQLRNFDHEGGFRSALEGTKGGLSSLELGKIYQEKQTIELPKPDELTPRVGIIVGVWHDAMRLPVVSGQTNGHEAALVASFATGVPRRPPAPPKPIAKDEKPR
ncbi:MAG TPA: hypothetical protein VHE30_28215 [Polyangiaceae bacterium]|nr:hypothetical protein [Polyangiaceae bacterium]